jgi:hypothetical protein
MFASDPTGKQTYFKIKVTMKEEKCEWCVDNSYNQPRVRRTRRIIKLNIKS